MLLPDSALGQVLIFKKWRYEDGAEGGVGITNPKKVPTIEDLEAARALVADQGQVVRNLKEEKGLTNDVRIISWGFSLINSLYSCVYELCLRVVSTPICLVEFRSLLLEFVFGYQDVEVQEAVSILLERKEELATLEKRMEEAPSA